MHHGRPQKNARQRVKSKRGQISIMIALMLLSAVSFLTFVTHTGILINAKINLQNAADLAAYAGAAVQARQLNSISFLNYEMRRQYKKFLFKYYVVGNFAQKSHPGPRGSKRKFTPDPNIPGGDYGVPVVCMTFQSGDNFCQVKRLMSIPTVNVVPFFDSIGAALLANLKKLEEIRQANCQLIGATNSFLLHYWLFSTHYDAKVLMDQIKKTPGKKVEELIMENVASLSAGIELVPKNILLSRRIRTLEEYTNTAPESEITRGRIAEMLDAPDRSKHERSIQAYLSAFHTLGGSLKASKGHVFDSIKDIVMTEFLPTGEDVEGVTKRILSLIPISVNFEAYALDQVLKPDGSCEGEANQIKVRDFIVGYYKDPAILTYYAIRLKAKANILFSPFRGGITLKAYAAAQPFGSRIGPQVRNISDAGMGFVAPGLKPKFGFSLAGPVNGVPNLPVKARSQDGNTNLGWFNGTVIAELSKAFQTPGQRSIDMSAYLSAMQDAMAPNPFEAGLYNIPNDVQTEKIEGQPTDGDPFISYFDKSMTYAIWAPITPPGKSKAEAKDQIIAMVDANIKDDRQREMFIRTFDNYLLQLENRQGEFLPGHSQTDFKPRETYNVYRMSDPFRKVVKDKIIPIELAAEIMISPEQTRKINSSWNDVKDKKYIARGRTGYSVKFVSFESLNSGNLVADSGGNTMLNMIKSGLDGEAEADVEKILH